MTNVCTRQRLTHARSHRAGIGTAVSALILALATSARAQMPTAAQPTSPMTGAELPHPFFTHMGLPEGVGNFNLRLLGLATQADGKSDGDFAFHLETGLTQNIGLHIRNDHFRTSDNTEAMFQYTALISKDGMSGFAPVIEFEFPTHRGASRVNTLVGFITSLGADRWSFNQVLHYDPRDDAVDASAALVVGATRVVFPVIEVLRAGGTGQRVMLNVLAGVKIRLRDWLTGGVAIAVPLTTARDYVSQLALGPDLEWHR